MKYNIDFVCKTLLKFKDEARINKIILELEIDDYLKQNCSELSKGTKKKIDIIPIFLELDKNIILLEEVISSLDANTVDKLFVRLKELLKQGKTIIIVEHNNKIIDRIKELDNSRLWVFKDEK